MNSSMFSYEYSSMPSFVGVDVPSYWGAEAVASDGLLSNAAQVITLINATPSVNVVYGLPKDLRLTTTALKLPIRRQVSVREDAVLRRAVLRSAKIIAKGRLVSK